MSCRTSFKVLQLCIFAAGALHGSSAFQHLSSWSPLSTTTTRGPMRISRKSTSSSSSSMFATRSSRSDGDSLSSSEEEYWRKQHASGSSRGNYTEIVEKKMRVAKKQSEIDRILNCPIDPPFDIETELSKVISISPPMVKEGSPEYDLEQEISHLEEDLYKAVKAQDYVRAQEQQQKISQRHVDDCGDVLQINSAFYKAFSKKDLKSMKHLWLQENTAVCIHPSHNPLLGYSDVMKGWKSMFESSNGSFQKNWMEPTNIRLSVRGSTAIITCEELVYVRRFVRGKKRQDELINKLLATNIFRKVDGKWYMNYHHTSWHADSEVAKYALQRSTEAATNSNANNPSMRNNNGGIETIPDGNGSRPKIVIRRPPRGNNEDGSVSGLDGILGMNNFGPVLGGEDSNNSNGGNPGDGKPPIKRVIMGSLSDLLNGGLGDILDGTNINGSGGGGENNNNNINGNGDEQSGTIIFSSSNIEGFDDDDDDGSDDHDHLLGDLDDDDEEDEDDEEDDDDEEGDEVIEEDIMVLSSKKSSVQPDPSNTNKVSSTSSNKKVNNKKQQQQRSSSSPQVSSRKDSIRQACIATLRKLSSRGSISAKQKRVLLTDIINCSAKGETSKVEFAYELLCGDREIIVHDSSSENNDNNSTEEGNDIEEEFADQCRVYAAMISSSDFTSPQHLA